MSRHVEVLRELKRRAEGEWRTWRAISGKQTKDSEEELALSAAIAALEDRESRVVRSHAYQPHPPDPRFCGCGVAASLHESERTATEIEGSALEAKESEALALASARGRALELETALKEIQCMAGMLSKCGLWEWAKRVDAVVENALYPPPPASPSIRDGTEHHDAAPPEGADEEPQELMDVLLTWLKPPSGDGDAGDR